MARKRFLFFRCRYPLHLLKLIKALSNQFVHNGKQFLVENYAIALTPGLQLLDSKALVRSQLTTLKAGLTEARQLKTSSSNELLEFSAFFYREGRNSVSLPCNSVLFMFSS